MDLKLVSLNINGLNDHLKRTALVDWLKCMKVDVVCLQETHSPSHESARKWFANSGYRVASSSLTSKSAGVAILVKDTYKIKKIIKDEDGRYVQAVVDFGEGQASFISLYAPNRNPARNTFFASLTGLIDLSRPTFVAGDFNSVLDPAKDRMRDPSYVAGPAAQQRESIPALESLMSFSQTYPLWRQLHPGRTAYSWTHGDGTRASRIDMVWAPTALSNYIKGCEYHPSFLSDHQYLLVEFSLNEQFDSGPGVWKLNASLLQDPEYLNLINSFWSHWQSMENHADFPSLMDWWDQGKFYLREVSRTFARAKAADKRGRKTSLTKEMHALKEAFDRGDRTAFARLCAVQQELRDIALYEAKGAQVRARCQWAEEGETSSSYFLNLESKHHARQTMYSIRDPATGLVRHDPFEILGVWRAYYDTLFTAQVCDPIAQDAMLSQLTRRLSQAERAGCEGCLTVDECWAALWGMPHGKTPGSDGLPMEFYKTFWQSLGADLVRVLNAAFEAGQLSTSQRRGLIIVLYKKNDPLDTKNWRPISLLNVDYKIATRAISGRLLGVMPTIVGPDQTCGVRGRTISENLAWVRDLLEYVEREDIPLALLSLDQEKAFDRVDWGFLLRILETFNFGPQFRNWVRLFYTDIQSAVIINGWMSSFFNPTRGVRQGCPLSPLLYVLSIEVLAECIRASPQIQGVTIPHSVEGYKCSGYADDTTVAVTTERSIEETFSVYSTYERASGAKLNRGKSKAMWAGSWKDRTDTPYGLQWVKQLPLLGATFSVGDYTTPTWEPVVSSLETRLASWSGRQLSFQGKAVVINTLGLSQFYHLCHVFPIPGWAGKRIDKAVWTFFWSGKRDLVARTTVTLPKAQGGFGVVNFRQKAEAFALQWLKRFFVSSDGRWKTFFVYFFQSTFNLEPRSALLTAQPRRLLLSLPTFYQLLFRVWRALDGGLIVGSDELGIRVSSDDPTNIAQLTSGHTYTLLRAHNYKEPHCIAKFHPTYGPLHWPETWRQLHICDLDRKVVDLNWQIAHGVLYTGARLAINFRMRGVDSRCFCATADETLEHLFFECELARLLVAWVYMYLHSINPTAGRFTVDELLFGFSEARRRAIPSIFIFMLMVMKHAIWVARCDFRFRQKVPIASNILHIAIRRIKFTLNLLFKRCKSPAQIRAFEREWLGRGSLGHLEGPDLVFSF